MQAPKKKPKKPKTEEGGPSEEVVPETWVQKATNQLPELLKKSSEARMSSIKLSNMEYAKELSSQLLNHAKGLEKLYSDLSKALTDGVNDKTLRVFLTEISKMEEFGNNAQACFLNMGLFHGVCLQCFFGNAYCSGNMV